MSIRFCIRLLYETLDKEEEETYREYAAVRDGAASSYIGTVARGAMYGQSLYADAGTIAGTLNAGVTGAVGEAISIGFAGDAAATKFLSGAGKLVTAGYGEAAKYGVYAGYSLAEGRKKVACTETNSMWL
jgi:hypothetical protein